MEKIILKDKTELKIMDGAGLNEITAVVSDWAALGGVADALTTAGNLDDVQFTTDETVTGKYVDMILESPLFSAVDVVGDEIRATFAIREKTDVEKRLDAVESGQGVQDRAIMEMKEMLVEREQEH